jgi:hypothetical protein
MQVNSAQDYLTAQKRRIVAATLTQDPPPAHRKYNYVYISVLANKASVYDKVAYPQTLSLVPGSVPGGVYLSTGAPTTIRSQAARPTVSTCCVAPQGANPLPGSLV